MKTSMIALAALASIQAFAQEEPAAHLTHPDYACSTQTGDFKFTVSDIQVVDNDNYDPFSKKEILKAQLAIEEDGIIADPVEIVIHKELNSTRCNQVLLESFNIPGKLSSVHSYQINWGSPGCGYWDPSSTQLLIQESDGKAIRGYPMTCQPL